MPSCPACAHACPEGGRYCPYCSAPLDATSAETAVMGAGTGSAPSLSSTSSVDEGRFLPGTVVAGRYRIAGLLGRGGMGEVYRATDLTLGQSVALKFLPEATAHDERALARFYNEVRVARQVTHPNVCRVYDVGQVQGLHYISMEFVDGEDLGSLLRRIGRLPVDKAVETARKICAGLSAAHDKGVLHRDLKPANVMIDGRGQVIIMDFGLAGLAEQLEGDIRSGTPAYMAPEQLAGTGVSVRSDIYALGLLLYELFTGKRAFEAASLMELMQLQERAAPVSITSMAKDVDPSVERVILRCLQPDPAARPASVLAVAAALPGGDPLAAALAAGETPSPEVLAAAAETDAIPVMQGLGWLGIVAACALLYAGISPRATMANIAPLEKAPAVLADRADQIIRDFGYQEAPVDTAQNFIIPADFQRWSIEDTTLDRWNPAKHPTAYSLLFWYRASPRDMEPNRQSTSVSPSDPPLVFTGQSLVILDTRGRLVEFRRVPPQLETSTDAAAQPDWNVVL